MRADRVEPIDDDLTIPLGRTEQSAALEPERWPR
jgi:hypothetical protein